jgi:hypothetical protein
MSFAIRQTFKPRNLVQELDPEDKYVNTEQENQLEKTQAIIEKIKQFANKSSHESLLSAEDFQILLKSSSINPEYNLSATSDVNNVMVDKQNKKIKTTSKTAPKDAFGFSTSSISDSTNGKQYGNLGEVLDRELEKISSRQNKHEDSDEDKEDDEDDEDDEEEKKQQIRKEKEAKRLYSYAYPISSSMVRGYVPRRGGMAGAGIRKTALGMSDSF